MGKVVPVVPLNYSENQIMFTPVFENDDQLTQNTTQNKPAKRGRSQMFIELQEMDPGDTWYQVDENAHPDAKKFRTQVYRHSKDGAGAFKIKTTNEGLFIKKTSRTYTPAPRKPKKVKADAPVQTDGEAQAE